MVIFIVNGTRFNWQTSIWDCEFSSFKILLFRNCHTSPSPSWFPSKGHNSKIKLKLYKRSSFPISLHVKDKVLTCWQASMRGVQPVWVWALMSALFSIKRFEMSSWPVGRGYLRRVTYLYTFSWYSGWFVTYSTHQKSGDNLSCSY